MSSQRGEAPVEALGAQQAPSELDAGRLRSILNTAHEAFVSIDARGRITEWNPRAEQMFGWARHEALGRELAATVIPPRYRSAHRRGIHRYLQTGQPVLLGRRIELTALHREGRELPVELSLSCVSSPGGDADGVTFHGFLHDITDRKLSERVTQAMHAVTQAMARAESPEQALSVLLDTLCTGMGWDLGTYWPLGEDGRMALTAAWHGPAVRPEAFLADSAELRLAAGEGLLGRSLALGRPVWVRDLAIETASPLAGACARDGLHAAICVPVVRAGATIGVLELLSREVRMYEGTLTDALSRVGEQVGELLGILEDRQRLLASLARMALTDQLTGLPNRRAWEEGLQRELARAARDQHPVCVAVLDLDHFKDYNDRHGHQAGDELLAAAAQAWLGQMRAGDLLARYGGEEFVAVFPAWPLEVAVMVIDRLRSATPLGQTCSAGVAAWDGAESAAELFARADGALYEAKRQGRDRTVAAA